MVASIIINWFNQYGFSQQNFRCWLKSKTRAELTSLIQCFLFDPQQLVLSESVLYYLNSQVLSSTSLLLIRASNLNLIKTYNCNNLILKINKDLKPNKFMVTAESVYRIAGNIYYFSLPHKKIDISIYIYIYIYIQI